MNTPEVTVKTFTVQEVIDAIAQDGFDHLRGAWFQKSFDGKLTGGCVLAQGGINLKVVASRDDGIDEVPDEAFTARYPTKNNGAFPTLIEQLNRFPVTKKKWQTGGMAGNAIVGWNDDTRTHYTEMTCNEFYTKNREYCEDWEHDPDSGDNYPHEDGEEYTLPTYTDVANMVKEILWPHRKKKVYLLTRDYSSFLAPVDMVQNG